MSELSLRKTCKEQLRPTPPQERQREAVLWRCRTRYTTALEQRITRSRQRGISVSRYQQEAELKALRAAYPEYAALQSPILHDVRARRDRTSQACFRRRQRGEQAGFPRFTGRYFKGRYGNAFHSFTFKEYGNGARLAHGVLVLATIGRLAVRWRRPLAGTPKTVTVSREADGWYVAIACADSPVQALPATGQEPGIDLGLERFATLADGSSSANPRRFRVAALHLKRAHRRVSRRVKGSHRRRTAVQLLAKAQQHRRRQRADCHHKTALALVRPYATLSPEDVPVANLVRNHARAKRLSDAGWGQCCTLLACKAADAGKRVVAVPPAYTSQVCSGGGVIVPKGLAVRGHLCPDCGTSLQRDHHAALTSLRLGQTQPQEYSGPGDGLQARTPPVGADVA